MGETPLFYALSRHKFAHTRYSLSQLFLECKESTEKKNKQVAVNFLHRNKDGKTVYEAYSMDALKQVSTGKCTGSSIDEAAFSLE